MTRNELSAFIDKVVGSKGIMRASVWWVKKLLNKMLDYCESLTPKIKVDSEMSDSSENAVSNKAIKEYVDDADNTLAERINALEQNSGGSNIEVDAELSESSTNAIANKAVTGAIVEGEEVTAVALTDLDKRLKDIVKILENAGLM